MDIELTLVKSSRRIACPLKKRFFYEKGNGKMCTFIEHYNEWKFLASYQKARSVCAQSVRWCFQFFRWSSRSSAVVHIVCRKFSFLVTHPQKSTPLCSPELLSFQILRRQTPEVGHHFGLS